MKYAQLILLLILICTLQIGISQNCLPSGISLSSQADIDNFATNYPECTHVLGDVLIFNPSSDITSLSGLSQIEYIGADLSIKLQSLTSIIGLENLDTIVSGMNIENNGQLSQA